MIVSAKPFLKFNYLFKRKISLSSSPWKNAIFFENGTDALISFLKLLNLPKGSKIAIPAYICNSIPAALRLHEYKPCFFDLPLDLNISSEYLENILLNDDISVFLLVDFFGFLSQKNLDASRYLMKKGYKVIIDRCHSGLSSRDCQKDLIYTDAIIFSFRKTFNSEDGGALITKLPKKYKDLACKGPNRKLFIFLRLIEALVCKFGWPNIYSPFFDSNKNKYHRENKYINERHKPSQYLVSQISDLKNINNVSKLRIKNFNHLTKIFKKHSIKILFDELDELTIPQVVAVIDDNQNLKSFLRINGIGACSWPGEEIDDYITQHPSIYPNTIELNKKVLCIPTHQSIRMRDISYIDKKLINWNMEHNE
jgi:dTDP-4-amino-4,6-dideoxygalactose transaminase